MYFDPKLLVPYDSYYLLKDDVIRPKVIDIVLNPDNITLIIAFSQNVSGNSGFSLDPSISMSYISGNGTNMKVYELSRPLEDNETLYISYSAGNIVNIDGVPLCLFTNRLVKDSLYKASYRFNDSKNSMYIGNL